MTDIMSNSMYPYCIDKYCIDYEGINKLCLNYHYLVKSSKITYTYLLRNTNFSWKIVTDKISRELPYHLTIRYNLSNINTIKYIDDIQHIQHIKIPKFCKYITLEVEHFINNMLYSSFKYNYDKFLDIFNNILINIPFHINILELPITSPFYENIYQHLDYLPDTIQHLVLNINLSTKFINLANLSYIKTLHIKYNPKNIITDDPIHRQNLDLVLPYQLKYLIIDKCNHCITLYNISNHLELVISKSLLNNTIENFPELCCVIGSLAPLQRSTSI